MPPETSTKVTFVLAGPLQFFVCAGPGCVMKKSNKKEVVEV